MRRQTLFIVVLLCIVPAGCARQKPDVQKKTPKQEQPTAERPIVLNQTDRGGGLVFGGPEGNVRCRLANDDAYARYAISPNGRVAACVTEDWRRTQARWVSFFDCSGNVTANVMLPSPPPSKAPMMYTSNMLIQISNASETLITITRHQNYEGPAIPGHAVERTVEHYYVLPSGEVKRIAAGHSEDVRSLLPETGGVVTIRGIGSSEQECPWHITRYKKGLEVMWETTVQAQHLIGYLEPKYDFSVSADTRDGRKFIHFHADGRSVIEPAPR